MSTSDAARPYTDEEIADERQLIANLSANKFDMSEDATSRWLATLAARDAELASLRLRYREALEVMDHLYRNVLGPARPKCDGCAEEIREALVQISPVLSTPEAIAIIKEGQS